MAWKRALIAGGVALLAVAIGLVYCSWDIVGPGSISHPDLEGIEELTGLDFPDGTEVLGSKRWDQLQFQAMVAKVQFDGQERDAFLRSKPKGEHVVPGELVFAESTQDNWMRWPAPEESTPRWWAPESVRGRVTDSWVDGKAGYAVWLLVSQQSGESATAYLSWSYDGCLRGVSQAEFGADQAGAADD